MVGSLYSLYTCQLEFALSTTYWSLSSVSWQLYLPDYTCIINTYMLAALFLSNTPKM